MSDDTAQDTAAAPVDQAPAPVTLDPAAAAAIAQAVVGALQAANPPAPAPADVPAPETGHSIAAAAAQHAGPAYPWGGPAAAPVDQADVDEPPYSEVFKPGSLAVHTYDHFGRTAHQVLLIVGTYQVPIVDPKTQQVVGMQDRVRFLPLGVTHESGDLPADAPELLPASEWDWEGAAA